MVLNRVGDTRVPIRVLIADDHPLLRDGIVSLVQSEADLLLVGEASNGREAVESFRKHHPDVTLMDLQMPEMDGIAAIVAIRSECPDAKIVVLTTYRGGAQVLRALKAGASGYLLKNAIRTDLLRAIRAAYAGDKFLPGDVATELAAHVTDQSLSSREIEVLKCVAAGNSNRTIAADLALAEDTVKSHMKNIMSKLGAKDRTHAVTIAISRGLINVCSAIE
jgi:DNA-binding NarL/FixJ family response regulator